MAGLTINDCLFTNITDKAGHKASEEEIATCLDSLPSTGIIVPLGNDALQALCMRDKITKWRGSYLSLYDRVFIPTLSPASVSNLQAPQPLNRWLIAEDLKRARYYADGNVPNSYDVKVSPTFIGAMDFIQQARATAKISQSPVSIDIEVINKALDCFSVGYLSNSNKPIAMCIPLNIGGQNYFPEEDELAIMIELAKLIEDKDVTKIGANFIFDLQFFLHHYGIIPRGELHCTQIAQKILAPDYPAGLDFVTSMHTDIPYYKADGKQWMKKDIGDVNVWWHYNGMDSIAPIVAHPKQMQELSRQGNLDTYNFQRKLIEPLIYCAEHGIKCDTEGMSIFKDTERARLDVMLNEWNELTGGVNAQSPKQLLELFYTRLGLPPYINRKTGKPATDADALKRIVRKRSTGAREAQLVLDMRGLQKRISTYLSLPKVDPDGYYRASFKPVGTETGRISSGETIYGAGGNLQNWPHDLQRFLIADDGYALYAMDLSQAENRIVAYVGNVINQIKAFEEGVDLHAVTASIIFQKSVELISKKEGSSDLGSGRQSERDWGKRGNHALNYDVSYKTFALKYEITETEAKAIIARLHKGYPEIRNGFQARVKAELFRSRTVTNLFGRKRLFLTPITTDRINQASSAGNTFREAYAQLPQSSVADKVNRHGIQFIWESPLFSNSNFLVQIHDSLVWQMPLASGFSFHAKAILALKESLEIPYNFQGRSFSSPADLAIGKNMCKEEMIEFKSAKIPNTAEELAKLLEESWTNLI